MTEDNEHNCRNDEQIQSDIEKFGLSVIIIEATDYLPSFAYSIGLWQKFNHPEIICFGLRTQTLHTIINDVADLIKNGQVIQAGKTYDNIFENSKSEFLNVDKRNLGDYFGTAIDFYNSKNFQALQLVWTDRNDKFPWETDFEEDFIYKQPLLDRNADFKSREAKNLGIFTTRQWLELDKPILRVVHDTDGDWQFLTGDQMPEDVKLVALEQMVIKDRTLNEVFDLDYGEEAEREFVGGEWTRNIVDYEDEE
ncbi:DUF4262 domain-containing protein [Kaistella montana]|uniref:DUF4262 domain-containing protein n=1 Tax=Kaistella montana TaxID=1849733 RepID=A0ABW5K9H2_9FLAO|nr:DUF4262 domain-containing protein [Kaistella montana]MCQ4035080.1 DUF4262 domain-containing protein [Kaistella montana]